MDFLYSYYKHYSIVYRYCTSTYYFPSGVHPTLTRYSSQGKCDSSETGSSFLTRSTTSPSALRENSASLSTDLAFGAPARGKRNSSESPEDAEREEGNLSSCTLVSSTSSYRMA